MQIELGTVIATSLVQVAIGYLFRMSFLRQVEKMDRLEEEVTRLKDERVAVVEEKLEAASASRGKIFERVSKLERESVTVQFCRENHRESAASLIEFRDAVIKLAATQVELRNTSLFVAEVNQRVIGLIQDVAEIRGRKARQ